ncbi:MAG TPA: hypothetical protein VKX28_18020 [Xanthobacteraceae bacterium]|nr:hypothetical protein [Xanthobacteraceae bacterium]
MIATALTPSHPTRRGLDLAQLKDWRLLMRSIKTILAYTGAAAALAWTIAATPALAHGGGHAGAPIGNMGTLNGDHVGANLHMDGNQMDRDPVDRDHMDRDHIDRDHMDHNRDTHRDTRHINQNQNLTVRHVRVLPVNLADFLRLLRGEGLKHVHIVRISKTVVNGMVMDIVTVIAPRDAVLI